MTFHFGSQTTVGGYRMDEVSSALQKTIRRSEERQAIFWVTELELSGYGNYAWKRIRTICSEDIGLAEPGMPTEIRALNDNWLEAKKAAKKDDPVGAEMLFLVHATLLLVRAAKSRIVDNACVVFYTGDRKALGIEIPDYAIDHHTARGRRMGRTEAKVWNESYKLVNPSGYPMLNDPYLAESHEIDTKQADRAAAS